MMLFYLKIKEELKQLGNLKRKTSKGKGKAHLEDAKSRISLLLDLDE